MVKLSNNQEKILNEIKNNLRDKGHPPTIKELCDSVGLSSTSSIHYHLIKLEKLGYIKRVRGISRSITVLK